MGSPQRREVDRNGEEGSDGDLSPIGVMACMIAEHRATVYLTAFYKGVEAAVKEVEDVVKTCDIYVAASTPSPNAEHESLALPFHEARKQGAVRCLKRIQGLIGLSELTKKAP